MGALFGFVVAALIGAALISVGLVRIELIEDRLHYLVELVVAPIVAVARSDWPAAFCLRPCSIEPKIYERQLESR